MPPVEWGVRMNTLGRMFSVDSQVFTYRASLELARRKKEDLAIDIWHLVGGRIHLYTLKLAWCSWFIMPELLLSLRLLSARANKIPRFT